MIIGVFAMIAMGLIGMAGQATYEADQEYEYKEVVVIKRVPVERLINCTLKGKEIRCKRK